MFLTYVHEYYFLDFVLRVPAELSTDMISLGVIKNGDTT
jgi:hypothetical protein